MRRLLIVTLSLALAACSAPPVGPADPSVVVKELNTWDNLNKVALNLYSERVDHRETQLLALFQGLGLTPAAALHVMSTADPYAALGLKEQHVRFLKLGFETGMSVTLESWVKQMAPYNLKMTDGAPVTADAIQKRLKAISELPTFTEEQRPLALLAALYNTRLGTAEQGEIFGDGNLDPLQLYLLNNIVLVKLVEAQETPQTLTRPALKPLAGEGEIIGIIKDAYGTGKEIFSDLIDLGKDYAEFAQFVDCTTFVSATLQLKLSKDRNDLWYKGNDQPFETLFTAVAKTNASITPAELAYYASNNCAPTSNGRFENVKLVWSATSDDGEQHGALAQNQNTTNASGEASNMFTAVDEQTPPEQRTNQNLVLSKAWVEAVVYGLSGKHPLLEWRAVGMIAGKDAQRKTMLPIRHYKAGIECNDVCWSGTITIEDTLEDVIPERLDDGSSIVGERKVSQSAKMTYAVMGEALGSESPVNGSLKVAVKGQGQYNNTSERAWEFKPAECDAPNIWKQRDTSQSNDLKNIATTHYVGYEISGGHYTLSSIGLLDMSGTTNSEHYRYYKGGCNPYSDEDRTWSETAQAYLGNDRDPSVQRPAIEGETYVDEHGNLRMSGSVTYKPFPKAKVSKQTIKWDLTRTTK